MSEQVTISDLVGEAVVSMTTVPRLINSKGKISSAACEHLLEVMERLDYRPSIIARGLATNCTGTLGLAVPEIAPPFFSVSAPGAEDKAHGEGYSIFPCSTKTARSSRLADDLLCGALSCELWRRRKEVVEQSKRSNSGYRSLFLPRPGQAAGGRTRTRSLCRAALRMASGC